jgi:hypothetical protein
MKGWHRESQLQIGRNRMVRSQVSILFEAGRPGMPWIVAALVAALPTVPFATPHGPSCKALSTLPYNKAQFASYAPSLINFSFDQNCPAEYN